MPEIMITRDGATVTITDGTHTRTWVAASPRIAKGRESSLRHDPVMAARWLGFTPKPTKMVRSDERSGPVSRQGPTITVRDDNGKIMRVHVCRNVQSAVDLEVKLMSDRAFAELWARDGDPKPPEVKRHGLERY